jgi:hypothetical protein
MIAAAVTCGDVNRRRYSRAENVPARTCDCICVSRQSHDSKVSSRWILVMSHSASASAGALQRRSDFLTWPERISGQGERRSLGSDDSRICRGRFRSYVSGTGLAPHPVMPLQTASVLRWVFRKRDRSLTCLLQRSGAESSYDIYVVPHWDVASAVVEQTDTPIRAFCRHAEIALALRAAGWSVIERSR